MNDLHVRKAAPEDLEKIFRLGFDAWGKGTEDEFLKECRASAKYARGHWYMLENKFGELASCLIVYPLRPGEWGLASLTTSTALRKQGYATKLISEVLLKLELDHPNGVFFLYSDIDPKFYEKFKFRTLPLRAQRNKSSICMVKGKNPKDFTTPEDTPEYF